jgi:signal transduction histidine kinase
LLLVLALFVITIVLAAIALLQLRGEHELARRRARFVSGVSHELRTPLTQIRLFAELLRDANPAVQAKRFEYARIIDEEAQRLTYLVDNVLAYSGLSEVTVRRENVAFSEIVQDTVERFEPLAASRAAKLRVLVPEGIVIAADDHALRRVLLNVLDNAVKYGPQGQTVCIALHVVDHSLQLTVDDAGPGIPIADRMRVFEPFVRLDHNAEGGTGIGLAIVHDLVAAMRGTVVIEEAPSGGTRVRLTWPL